MSDATASTRQRAIRLWLAAMADVARADDNPALAGQVNDVIAEFERLLDVEGKAQAYIMAGLCGNPDRSAELGALIEAVRTDRAVTS